MTTFLLDTDIGTDVDDALALCFMLDAKPTSLLGIIVTNGPTKIRSQVAKTILMLKRAAQVPVFRGQSTALTNRLAPFVTGNESAGIDGHSRAFPLKSILPLILSQPDHTIVYVLIAPASTCAKLLEISEVRKKIKSIVVMGGVIGTDSTLPQQEHNISADPVAFSRICEFQTPIYLIPLNLTITYALPDRAMLDISGSHEPLAKKISQWIRLWLVFTRTFGQRDHWFRGRILLHDPFTCLAAIRKSAFRWKQMQLTASQDGVLQSGNGRSMHVATGIKKGVTSTLMSQIVLSIVTHINMV